MATKIKVLFLAANPLDTERLGLDEEARAISRVIQGTAHDDCFELQTEWAVRKNELQEVLLKHNPQVVHFAGHGWPDGLYLAGENDSARVVRKEALKELFGVFGTTVRVVFLNACESLSVVDTFRSAVDYCVGMKRGISDQAACEFATAFYRALAHGRSVEDAFRLGRAELLSDPFDEADTPVLRIRRGANRRPLARASAATGEEAHYLRTLAARSDALHIVGEVPGTQPHLGDVFTPPFLTLRRVATQRIADAIRPGSGGRTRAGSATEPVAALEAVSAVARLVVLADAGYGKSVLVNHVAAQLARRRLGDSSARLRGWDSGDAPLPVVVVLRELAASLVRRGAAAGPPGASWIWDHVSELLGHWGCADALPAIRGAVRQGDAIVFFDGLDEVAGGGDMHLRTQLARAIREFAAPLGDTRVVVTCRRYAYRSGDPWLLPPGEFPVVELGPFGVAQIIDFVFRWYVHAGREQGWSGAESARRAKLLSAQITGAPHLRALAESPLLLTLMARIHREDQALPDGRAALYERAIDLLLAEWENAKEEGWEDRGDPALVARLGVPVGALRACLAELAYEAHAAPVRAANGGPVAAPLSRHRLLDALESLAGGLDPAKGFIEYIRVRTGLLAEREDHTYVFPHRTFQEFLAATHLLAGEEYPERLVCFIRSDFVWWREVFYLAAATLERDPIRLAILADAVLVEAEDAPSEALVHAAGSVAVAMAAGPFLSAATGVKRYARLAARMRDFLLASMLADGRLPPPVRAAAATALARLGDPREEVRDPATISFRRVPAGAFPMGSGADDPDAYPEELPLTRPVLAYDFWIARFPVTAAQFRGYEQPESKGVRAADSNAAETCPEVVTWHEAMAFCRWLTARLAERGRQAPAGDPEWWSGVANGSLVATLPSEAEWEKAARGGEGGPRFPWGDEPDPNRANYEATGIGAASPVGCFPGGASPFGVEEMSGNVWEWTRSLWGTDEETPSFLYPYDPADGREDPAAGNDVLRVQRGGGFNSSAQSARAASRNAAAPGSRELRAGFRVAMVPASALRAGHKSGEQAADPGQEGELPVALSGAGRP